MARSYVCTLFLLPEVCHAISSFSVHSYLVDNDTCMFVWGGGRKRERAGREERESVCVCRWIHRSVPPLPPPPSVYLALRANDEVRRFLNIHLHYITCMTFTLPCFSVSGVFIFGHRVL